MNNQSTEIRDIPVEAFWPDQNFKIREIVDGLVHRTFLVETTSGRFILQRINTYVFKDAHHVIANIQLVTAHLHANPEFTLQVPLLKKSKTGDLCYEGKDGTMWRCFYFIEGTTKSVISNSAEALLVAKAFGQFAAALSGLSPESLHYTIRGFHDSKHRTHQFDEAIVSGVQNRIRNCESEIKKVKEHYYIAEKIQDLQLPLRIAHNDPKLSNVLFDKQGNPVGIIDLDTVMPGSPLHDFGDLVRSMAASTVEDDPDLSRVYVKKDIYLALEKGFLEGTMATLTSSESKNLKTGAAYIIFEQALRFLADYLVGDIYYRIKSPTHNLIRAQNQLRLLESFLQEVGHPG